MRRTYLPVISVVTALLPASFLLICANVSSFICKTSLPARFGHTGDIEAGSEFFLLIWNAGNPPAVTVVGLNFIVCYQP